MICRIACCDDESEELHKLKRYFETMMMETEMRLEIDYFTAGGMLLQQYKKEQSPYDVLVLDVEMPEVTGLKLSEKIREMQNRNVLILFLTSYPQYMQQSFYVQTFQYILKPVSYEAFRDEIMRAYQYIREDERHILLVGTKEGEAAVHMRNILCIEKEKGIAMMSIVMMGGTMLARGNLNDLEEPLREQPFLRISRSCLVNMEHIVRFVGTEIELDNGRRVTMSRRKVTEIKNTFTKYAVLGEMG